MMGCWDLGMGDSHILARRRFEAKLAKMRARGVRVLVGSTLWNKLSAAARKR